MTNNMKKTEWAEYKMRAYSVLSFREDGTQSGGVNGCGLPRAIEEAMSLSRSGRRIIILPTIDSWYKSNDWAHKNYVELYRLAREEHPGYRGTHDEFMEYLEKWPSNVLNKILWDTTGEELDVKAVMEARKELEKQKKEAAKEKGKKGKKTQEE